MFVVIMGCGRVGRLLAARMEALGHNVSVIDVKSEALAKLGNDFHGKRVLGQGFDRNVLTEAGITEADAFRGGIERRQHQHYCCSGSS